MHPGMRDRWRGGGEEEESGRRREQRDLAGEAKVRKGGAGRKKEGRGGGEASKRRRSEDVREREDNVLHLDHHRPPEPQTLYWCFINHGHLLIIFFSSVPPFGEKCPVSLFANTEVYLKLSITS